MPIIRPTAPTAAAVLGIALVLATAASAPAQSAFPNRDGTVANGTAMTVSTARINNDFRERIAEPFGLEGLALVVDDCRPDPEVYLDQALVHYGLAPWAGAQNNDALVWLVCLDPRFVGFFYAADNPFAGVLDEDAATDVMVDDLRDENFTGAFTGSIDAVAGQLAASSWAPAPADGQAAGAADGGNGDTGGVQAGGGLAGGLDGASASGDGAGATEDGSGSAADWLAPLATLGLAGAGLWWWRQRASSAGASSGRGLPAPVRALDEKLALLDQRLTPVSTALARLVLAYESLGDEAVLALNKRHESMVARLATLHERAARLRAEALGDGSNGSDTGSATSTRAESGSPARATGAAAGIGTGSVGVGATSVGAATGSMRNMSGSVGTGTGSVGTGAGSPKTGTRSAESMARTARTGAGTSGSTGSESGPGLAPPVAGTTESAGAADRMAEAYAAPLAEADALLDYVDGLESEADRVEVWQEKAPVLAVEARRAIESAGEQYAGDSGGLDLPGPEIAFRFPTALVDAAEASLSAGQRIAAGRQADDAAAIAERLGALPDALKSADRLIDEAAAMFPRFDGFAESSWADIRGNGTEAEESLDTAVDMLARIVASDNPAFGSDAASGFMASLDQVDAEIDRARRLATAVKERLAFLQRAQEQAAAAIAAVQDEIDTASAWLKQPDVDPDVSAGPGAALGAAEAALQEARLATGSPKPDWVALLRQVNAADRAADDALAGARAEQERVAARRRQVESARTDASAAVDRVERFLGAHRGDASAPTVEQVGAARSALARAEEAARAAEAVEDVARAEGLAAAAAAFQAARELADAAYDALASEVARAEDTRRTEVRRRDWLGPLVPTPMSPWPRGGSWGGLGGSMGGSISRPSRPTSWGSRPSGGGTRTGGSSSRRGGGRGW